MTTLDYEAALVAVNEWLDKIEERIAATTYDGRATLEDWFEERSPLLQRIAALFEPQLAQGFHKYTGGGRPPWTGTRDNAIRLRGLLLQREEREQLFGRPGPKLDAEALHPWVWDAARHLWAGEHYRNAVANAATSVEVLLKAKLGREDVSGAKLVGEAFSLELPVSGRPRLRFPEHTDPTSERYRSAHLGAMHLGQGCFEGIRNWAAHELEEQDRQVALEYLAALSVFARWADRAAVVDP